MGISLNAVQQGVLFCIGQKVELDAGALNK